MKNRIIGIVIALAAIILIGAIGFAFFEEHTFFESLYWAVVTLASVGYGDMTPKTPQGRLFTILLIMSGMGVIAYGLSMVTAIFVEGELKDVLRRRKMEKQIKNLSGHHIICGAGLTGRYMALELSKTQRPVLVIERSEEQYRMMEEHADGYQFPHVIGDATDEEVLKAAGIERAVGLLATLPSDKDNLLIALTARGLNPNLRIVARGIDHHIQDKLKKAGADEVVLPNKIGALRLVSLLVRPAAVSFLDTMLREEKGALRIEDVPIAKGSAIEGKSLSESRIREGTGVIVMALKYGAGRATHFNPSADTLLKAGDVMVVMGKVDEVKVLEKLAGIS